MILKSPLFFSQHDGKTGRKKPECIVRHDVVLLSVRRGPSDAVCFPGMKKKKRARARQTQMQYHVKKIRGSNKRGKKMK